MGTQQQRGRIGGTGLIEEEFRVESRSTRQEEKRDKREKEKMNVFHPILVMIVSVERENLTSSLK